MHRMKLGRIARRLGLLGAMGLAVAGCESGNQGRLAAQGAGVGAATGGLAGLIFGGRDRGNAALIGAGVGAALGGVTGAVLGSRQDAYATTEGELQARTAEARAASRELQGEAIQASRAASRLAASLNPLRSQVAAGRALSGQQAQALRGARQDRDAAAAALRKGEQQLGQLQDQIARLKGSGANTYQLQQEADDIARSNASLNDSLRRLNADLGRIEI
jgi:hypothetical protein